MLCPNKNVPVVCSSINCWKYFNWDDTLYLLSNIYFYLLFQEAIINNVVNFSSFHRSYPLIIVFSLQMFQDIHYGDDDDNFITIMWVKPWMNGCWAGATQILFYLSFSSEFDSVLCVQGGWARDGFYHTNTKKTITC